MPLVKMPDGQVVDMPDQLSPVQLEALQSQHKPAGFLESAGRNLVSGFGQAASLAPRAAQMVAGHFGPADEGLNPEDSGTVTNPRTNPLSRTLGDTADSVEQYWKEVGDRSNSGGWWKAFTRGVGGAAAAPVGGLPGLVAGGTGGLGVEAAERAAPGNPLAAIAGGVIGGVVGGGVAALAQQARPQSANLAREVLDGVSPEQLKAAAAYQAAVRAQGHDIDLSQALVATSETGGGTLTSIRNTLAGSTQGDKTQAVLNSQSGSLTRDAELAVHTLPGVNRGPAQNAANVQETATGVLKQATDARSAAVRSLYAKAGNLPPEARGELTDLVKEMISRPGTTEVLQARGQEIIKRLSGQDDKLAAAVAAAREKVTAATSPSTKAAARAELGAANAAVANATTKPLRALDVDTWINELRGPWQGQPLKVAYPKEQGQIKGLAGALNERFQALSPEVKRAEQVFKQITEQSVNPLKQGPIGSLSQARGYDPATAAMVSRFDGLLNKGSDVGAKTSDIATAAKELAKVNPDAFESAFKGWLSKKVRGALSTSTAELPLAADRGTPSRIYDTLFKDPLQWQGIKDATAQMAKIRGEKPEDMIRGLENLHSLARAMKSTPESISGMSAVDLKRIGGGSATANLVRLASFLPMNRLGEGIERTVLGNTLSKFDDILTSPEGAKMLIDLGKVPVMSRKAQVILGTFAGSYANSDGIPAGNPPTN